MKKLVDKLIGWFTRSAGCHGHNCNKGEAMAVSPFAFVKFGSKMKDKQKKLREAFSKLEAVLSETLKENREKGLAKEAVESAYVWASRSVRSEQVDRNARNR